MKNFKVFIGDSIDYAESVEEASVIINRYFDWWFNDIGGMGTPRYKVIDLRAGQEVCHKWF